ATHHHEVVTHGAGSSCRSRRRLDPDGGERHTVRYLGRPRPINVRVQMYAFVSQAFNLSPVFLGALTIGATACSLRWAIFCQLRWEPVPRSVLSGVSPCSA